ncbi:aromatic amino acid transport family protein [Corynebacterium striatum]|uniref:aromatic amino acid transport family protein n=1 Tax=Corynebacterium TaxID=1716 RepID=UPI0020063A18|nr:amino acid permease [Corynebacterium simulans]MCK6160647.1 amino acid permease [Corynebacterium simulans]
MTVVEKTEGAAPQAAKPALSFVQGIALIFGTNIGAGILSIPYAARNGGFMALVIALLVAGTLTTISMLYVAESAMRTKAPLQVSGLAEHYLGQWGRWLVFLAIIINGVGALIAYASGSGQLINNIFGAPPLLGTLIFFGFGSWVMYRGLHTTGATEGAITAGMAIIIAILCGWTFIGPGIKAENLLVLHPFFIVPILNLAVFSFVAQYVVPELVQGMDPEKPHETARAIVVGMVITGFTLALVPFAALGLLGMDVTEVVTIAWGEKLGPVAYYLANIFALAAMLTSFLAIGFTTMRNILDMLHWEGSNRQRAIGVALTVLPPLVISVVGLGGFVAALSYAGGFAGAIMSIIPVMLLHASRKHGDKETRWNVGVLAHPLIQGVIIVVYFLAFVYSVLSIVGLVPAGWA